jgi:molecular chaperone GrpE
MNEETTPEQDKNDKDKPEAAEAEIQDDRVAELEAEVTALKDKVLYAQADTENVRRRLEKDKADAIAYASTAFARDMLSVADNLARAVAAIPAEAREDDAAKAIITGVEMVAKELDSIFQRHGISRIVVLGEKIDPNRHQAMFEIEGGGEPGTIVQEVQPGYMLRDRLLRPSLVGVAKAAADPSVGGSKVDIEV